MSSLVLLLLLYGLIIGNPASLVFNRIDVAHDAHKHIYVKLHGHSHETGLVNTMVLFRSPLRQMVGPMANTSHDAYHNALLIGSQTYRQYYKITKDSHFVYNNEIPLIARGVDLMLPFTVIDERDTWSRVTRTSYTDSSSGAILDNVNVYATESGSSTAYHAILSLDRYSAIWDRYNIMTLTRHYMTLRYDVDGSATNTLDEYDGIASLRCQYDSRGRCHVETSRLLMGGVTYNNSAYRLIIDLHSSSNYLPASLYFHYQTIGRNDRLIWIDSLPLNEQFEYALNEFDNDLILGVDLLHRFAKTELAIESGELHLWYFGASYIQHATHTNVAIFLIVPLLLCLFAYFEFIGSEPGALFSQIVRFSPVTSRWYYFRVRQIFIELLVIVAASLLCLVSLLFTEYNSTSQSQRTILFAILTLYHVVIIGIVFIVTPDATKHAFRLYFKRGGDTMRPSPPRDYALVQEAYLEGEQPKLSRERTVNVIARNTCLVVLIITAVMTKLNFTSEECYLYLLVLFVISLVFLYFFAHYVSLAWLYWLVSREKTPLSYRLFVCGETVMLLFYIGWSIPCLYLDYFRAINSVYTEAFVIAATLTLVSFLVLFACRSHYTKLLDLIQTHYST